MVLEELFHRFKSIRAGVGRHKSWVKIRKEWCNEENENTLRVPGRFLRFFKARPKTF
jgi:hypothetical protein